MKVNLERLPGFARWLLTLPAALLGLTLGQTLGMPFAVIIQLSGNALDQFWYLPSIWLGVYVMLRFGAAMAPSGKFVVGILLSLMMLGLNLLVLIDCVLGHPGHDPEGYQLADVGISLAGNLLITCLVCWRIARRKARVAAAPEDSLLPDLQLPQALIPHRYPRWIQISSVLLLFAMLTSLAEIPRQTAGCRVLQRACRHEIDHPEVAIADYQKALELLPTSKAARIGMARMLFARKNTHDDEEAMKRLEGVNLSQSDFDSLSTVMPEKYKKSLHSK